MSSYAGRIGTIVPVTVAKRPDELRGYAHAIEFRKSQLGRIAAGIACVPVTCVNATASGSELVVLKADRGSGGEHFVCQAARSPEHAARFRARRQDWVIQPYLSGLEMRATIVQGRQALLSRVVRTSGGGRAWVRVQSSRYEAVLGVADALRERLGLRTIGCDVMLCGGRVWVLDANPDPDLAVHGHAA